MDERMRDALNSNPIVQIAVIGVLLAGVGFFVLSSSGGGEEGSEGGGGEAEGGLSSTTVTTQVEAPAPASPSEALSTALSLAQGAASDTPRLPRPVIAAWHDNKTLVLLFVRDGGIDDRLVKIATKGVAAFPGVALFVVPARKISRYAAITEGVGVDRVPALVVVTPKHLKHTVPTASASYGFRSPQSVRQAVVDAGYKGRTVQYHP
jgi:hypothetical protein